MVRIIQAYRDPNPIAESIRRVGQSLQANRPSALEAQKLEDARQKAQALYSYANQLPPGPMRDAVVAGLSANDYSGYNLSAAAQGALDSGVTDFVGDRGINAAQFGAGMSAGSTGQGFREGETNQTLRNKYSTDVSASTSRANNAASIAAANAQAAARLAEDRRQYDMSPEEVVGMDGRPAFVRRGDIGPGIRPITSLEESKGLDYANMVDQNLLDLSQRRAAIGAIPSETEAKGDVLMRLVGGETIPSIGPLSAPALRNAFGLTEPTAPEVLRLQTPDGQAFASVDGGRTDMNTGAPIPANALAMGKFSPTGSRADAGLLTPTAAVATDQYRQNAALRQFQDTSSVLRSVAEGNPQAFGAAGLVRRGLQGAGNVVSGIDDLLGGAGSFQREIESLSPEARSLLPGIYDPSLDSVNRFHQLLLFQAASALAGQEGRSVTDADIKRMETVVPPPQGLFMSPQGFVAALDDIDTLIRQTAVSNQERMTGRFDVNTPGGAIPRITSDAEFDALPPGTEFIAPDGTHRRKP